MGETHSEVRNNPLIIIDPGLRDLSGHHAGMLFALCDSVKKSGRKLIVFGQYDATQQLTEKIKESEIEFHPFFTVNFYQHLFKFKRQALLKQVHLLAHEYCKNLQAIKNEYGENVTCVHHTLDYPHARALNTALQSKPLGQHVILLMFSPEGNGQANELRPLHYQFSFRCLLSRDDVIYFASEIELAEQYQDLLKRTKAITLHPCCVVNQKTVYAQKRRSELSDIKQSVLLYLGDAKADKGFNQLPEILEQLQATRVRDYEYIIHYTLTNNNHELSQTAAKLQRFASKHTWLRLKTVFLSEESLLNLFVSASAIVFNYCPKTYLNKNSGVLWLAVFFQLPLLLMNENWLSREAKHLGAEHYSVNVLSLNSQLMAIAEAQKGTPIKKLPLTQTQQAYRNVLFQSFGDWLVKQLERLEKESQ